MHGIIGQLAHDPVRLAIAVMGLIASVAIIRCLSGLAFFHSAARHGHDVRQDDAAGSDRRGMKTGELSTKPSASPEE